MFPFALVAPAATASLVYSRQRAGRRSPDAQHVFDRPLFSLTDAEWIVVQRREADTPIDRQRNNAARRLDEWRLLRAASLFCFSFFYSEHHDAGFDCFIVRHHRSANRRLFRTIYHLPVVS